MEQGKLISDNSSSEALDHETARTGRKFAVSANRERAVHRVRYVETGGAAVDPGECVFCDTTPDVECRPDKLSAGKGS